MGLILGNTISTSAAQLSSGIDSSTTTPDGRQAFLILGDSTHKTQEGVGATGPTPLANTIYEWNGSAVVNITTDSANANTSTIIPRLGNEYFNNFGFKSVFVNKASSGASYTVSGDTNNWANVGGILWADAVTNADACLAAMGITKFAGIFVSCGVNDGSDPSALASVESDLKDFFSRLTTKYPNTPILVHQVGAYSSVTIQTTIDRLVSIRKWHKEMTLLYPNVHFVGQNASFVGNSTGMYQTNTAHKNQVGLNATADQIVRWYKYPTLNKWARSIVASQFQELTSAQRDAINTFTQTEFYLAADFFALFKNNVTKDATLLDFTFSGAPFNAGFTFSSATGITTNPTGSLYYRTGFIPETGVINATETDFWFGARVGTNSTAAGTQAGLVGCSNVYVSQEATSRLLYRINETGADVYLTDTKFANNTYYSGHRSGTTKSLYKGSTQVASASLAGGASFPVTVLDVGGRNNNTTPPSIIINSTIECAWFSKGSINIANAISAMDTLITAFS